MEPKRIVAVFISLMVVSSIVIGIVVTELMKVKGGGSASAGVAVEIRNFEYIPRNITVTVNTTVTWTNNDSVAHTVTTLAGAPVSFDSGTLNPGARFSYTFAVEGTYPYYCMIHPFMRGNVIVVGGDRMASVNIQNLAFVPVEIAASLGTTVTWTNMDSMAHTGTSRDGAPETFDGGTIDPGGKYSRTFTAVGVYLYYCQIHPWMLGNVTVTS